MQTLIKIEIYSEIRIIIGAVLCRQLLWCHCIITAVSSPVSTENVDCVDAVVAAAVVVVVVVLMSCVGTGAGISSPVYNIEETGSPQHCSTA